MLIDSGERESLDPKILEDTMHEFVKQGSTRSIFYTDRDTKDLIAVGHSDLTLDPFSYIADEGQSLILIPRFRGKGLYKRIYELLIEQGKSFGAQKMIWYFYFENQVQIHSTKMWNLPRFGLCRFVSFVPFFGNDENLTPVKELQAKQKYFLEKFDFSKRIRILWSTDTPAFTAFVSENLSLILERFEGLENLANPLSGLLKSDTFTRFLKAQISGLETPQISQNDQLFGFLFVGDELIGLVKARIIVYLAYNIRSAILDTISVTGKYEKYLADIYAKTISLMIEESTDRLKSESLGLAINQKCRYAQTLNDVGEEMGIKLTPIDLVEHHY